MDDYCRYRPTVFVFNLPLSLACRLWVGGVGAMIDLLMAACCRWFFNTSHPWNDTQSSHNELVVDIEHFCQLCSACSEVRDWLVNGQLMLMRGLLCR